MNKVLYDFKPFYYANGNIEGYYLISPADEFVWVQVYADYYGNSITWKIYSSSKFDKYFGSHRSILGDLEPYANDLENIKNELIKRLVGCGFKIISRELEIYA